MSLVYSVRRNLLPFEKHPHNPLMSAPRYPIEMSPGMFILRIGSDVFLFQKNLCDTIIPIFQLPTSEVFDPLYP